MPKGSIDWSQRVDIFQQTLTEVNERIVTGLSRIYTNDVIVTPNSSNLLTEILGDGQIVSIEAIITDSNIINLDYFSIEIDNILSDDFNVSIHRDYFNIENTKLIASYPSIDDNTFLYSWVLMQKLSFRNSARIYFNENQGRSPNVKIKSLVGIFS